MKNKRILIVGGFGGVRRTIAILLSNELPRQVIVAGRNYQRASKLAVELDGRVLPLQLEIFDTTFPEDLLDNVALAVLCATIIRFLTSFVR